MNDIFGSGGFDARRDIEGIILNRWGHALLHQSQVFILVKKTMVDWLILLKKDMATFFMVTQNLGLE